MNGLDLFSGIGGLSLALDPWVKPIAYCESDPFARSVLLSRMFDGQLPVAPIWDDVRTLNGHNFLSGKVDIIYGGFPCQDVSSCGMRKGLAGKRTNLFFEILRLSDEILPTFLFFENVVGIRPYLSVITEELANRGYDFRWDLISASEVGAPHKRNRWFCLAYNKGVRRPTRAEIAKPTRESDLTSGGYLGDAACVTKRKPANETVTKSTCGKTRDEFIGASWWETEPELGRMANGVPDRVDRIKALGNAVVPAQAREAFKRLMGLSE